MEENDGTNSTPKVETEYHANMDAIDGIPQHKRLVTKIGSTKKSLQKYEIYFLVPETDEESKARYGVPLSALIIKGVQGLSTGPDYPGVGFNFDVPAITTVYPKNADKPFVDYPLKVNAETGNITGHIEMQTLADGYKPGMRVAATGGQKVKAAKYDALNAGMAAMGVDEAKIAEIAKLPTEPERQLAFADLMAKAAKTLARKAKK